MAKLCFTDELCLFDQTVFVEFPPGFSVLASDTTVCSGSTVLLSASSIMDPVQSGYIPSMSLDWSNGGTGSQIEVNQEGNYIVTLNHACGSAQDTSTLTFNFCDLNAPNVIVLSSTEGNDAFFVNYSGITDYECVIMNRWGNVVYEYFDPTGTWPGTNMTGKVLDEGTYFYKINAVFEGGQEIQKHGFVMLKY